VNGPEELHPPALTEELLLTDPKTEKIRSGFGSPQTGQFTDSFDAPRP
jgi:hypothetical protein